MEHEKNFSSCRVFNFLFFEDTILHGDICRGSDKLLLFGSQLSTSSLCVSSSRPRSASNIEGILDSVNKHENHYNELPSQSLEGEQLGHSPAW